MSMDIVGYSLEEQKNAMKVFVNSPAWHLLRMYFVNHMVADQTVTPSKNTTKGLAEAIKIMDEQVAYFEDEGRKLRKTNGLPTLQTSTMS